MNREDLVTLCESFAFRRGVFGGRVTTDAGPVADPVPEIVAAFLRAEISESEKNALVALVRDTEDEDRPLACVVDSYEFGPADHDDD
jgi:hypothetical protein